MAELPEVVPRDDRAWPRGSAFVSAMFMLAAVGTGGGLVVAAAGRGTVVMGTVLVGFVAAFGFGYGVFAAAYRHRVAGRPVPARFEMAGVAAVVVAFVVLYAVDGSVGGAMLAGVFAGMALANARAIRAARANRPLVDTAEAALAAHQNATIAHTHGVPLADGAAVEPSEPVGHALHQAIALEGRRWLAWLIAAGVVTAAGVVLDAPGPFAVGVVCPGGLALVGVTRRLWAAWLARRDFIRAATPPRRAYVALLADPTPQTTRPLLGIWPQPPVARGGRMPTPERVYRCGDEHDALECRHDNLVIHEAWIDTGPRPASKPRWVAADAGIAVPHRRPLLLGRWYMAALILGEHPGPPQPLTRPAPHPDTEPPPTPPAGNLLTALTWRLAALAASGLLLAWLT